MDREKQETELGKIGEEYFEAAQYQKALSAFSDALKIAAERGDHYAQSIWLSNIGLTYIRLSEYNQAEKYLEKALKISIELGLPEDEIYIRSSLAMGYCEEGNFEKSKEHLEIALKIAKSTNNRRVEASVCGHLGNVYSIAGAYDKAKISYNNALSIATDLNDIPQIGLWSGNIGNNLLGLGENARAIEYFEKALKIAKQVGNSFDEQKWEKGLSQARNALSREERPDEEAKEAYQLALMSQGRVSQAQAIDLWLCAAQICRRVRDYRHCGDGLSNAGVILNDLKRFQEADRRFEEALDVYQIVDDKRRIGLAYLNQGVSQRDRGNQPEAISLIKKAVELLRLIGDEFGLAAALTTLADICFKNNEKGQAIAMLEEVERLNRANSNYPELAKTLLRLGAAVYEKEPERAAKLFNDSIKLANEAKSVETSALALLSLSTLLKDQGKIVEAISKLQESKAQVVSKAPSELSIEYLSHLGMLLKQQGNEEEAFKIWQELLDIAEENEDEVSAVRALDEICIAFARRLREYRARYKRASPQSIDEPPKRDPTAEMPGFLSNPEENIRLITLNSESNAIELMRMMMQAESLKSRHQIILAHATEFNEVFFSSLHFNVKHAIESGDKDRAKAFEQLARMIADVLGQSLRIAETLSEQLLDENQELIIHLEPGAKLSPQSEDNNFNIRAASVIYREGLVFLAMQKPMEASDRFQDALKFFEYLGDRSEIANCLEKQAFCALHTGNLDAGIEYGHKALEKYNELEDSSGAARVLLVLGDIELIRDRFAQAIQYNEQACQFARKAQNLATEGSALANIGIAYHRMGNNEMALQWQEQALEIKRKQSDPNSLISTLLNLGNLYRDLNCPEKSKKAFIEARSIIKNSKDKHLLATFLNHLAAEKIREHAAVEAESLLYEAKEIADKIEDSYLQSRILQNLIFALRDQGKWTELEQALEAAAKIEDRLGSNTGAKKILLLRADTAMLKGATEAAIHAYKEVYLKHREQLSQMETLSVLHSLWMMLSATGDFNRAKQFRQHLEKIIQQITDTEVAEDNLILYVRACLAYSSLANRGEAEGQRALRLLDRAIELTKNKEDIEECAELYENRASILRTIGQLKESVEFHRLALDIATKKKRDRLRANILANMGTVFREMGQLNDSEFAYRQALELARALNAFGLQAQILAKSTSVLFHLGKHKEAENMARESIAICRHIGDHETEAKAHITLALLHYIDNSIDFEKEIQAVLQDDSISRENRAEALGLLALELRDQHRYDEAIEKIEDAITIGRINVIEQAASHFYAGMIYKEASLLNKALDHCENALKLAGSDAASHLTANVNQLQGDIYRENGDLNSAYRKYRAGMDKLELLRRNVAGEQNQSRSLGDLANIPEKLVNVLIEMDRTTEAFSALEAAKSRSLLERLSLIEIQAPQNVSSENRNKETHLIEQIRSLENRINNTVSLVQKERLISEFKKTVSDYNRLLDEISKVAPDFVELRRGKILAFEEVRELL